MPCSSKYQPISYCKTSQKLHYFDCITQSEKIQLRKFNKLAKKSGYKLILHLENGDTKVFTSTSPSAEKGDFFFFLGYLPEQKYFIVLNLFYEGEQPFLIDARTGKEYLIPGEFFISPDGKKVVSSSMDVESGGQFRNNAIKIFRFDKSNLIEEWSLQPSPDRDKWGPVNPQWIDNNTMAFVQDYVSRCSSHQMRVKLIKGKWQLLY